jgi:hypothetical protein
LEGAGNYLTRQILPYWSQNKHLQMRFDVRPAQGGDPEGMRQASISGVKFMTPGTLSRPDVPATLLARADEIIE